jgi:hypothetical protein
VSAVKRDGFDDIDPIYLIVAGAGLVLIVLLVLLLF